MRQLSSMPSSSAGLPVAPHWQGPMCCCCSGSSSSWGSVVVSSGSVDVGRRLAMDPSGGYCCRAASSVLTFLYSVPDLGKLTFDQKENNWHVSNTAGECRLSRFITGTVLYRCFKYCFINVKSLLQVQTSICDYNVTCRKPNKQT